MSGIIMDFFFLSKLKYLGSCFNESHNLAPLQSEVLEGPFSGTITHCNLWANASNPPLETLVSLV